MYYYCTKDIIMQNRSIDNLCYLQELISPCYVNSKFSNLVTLTSAWKWKNGTPSLFFNSDLFISPTISLQDLSDGPCTTPKWGMIMYTSMFLSLKKQQSRYCGAILFTRLPPSVSHGGILKDPLVSHDGQSQDGKSVGL